MIFFHFSGRLYATVNYLCFYANIFRWETSVALRWKDVNGLTKEKTALVIPNAIQVSILIDGSMDIKTNRQI